MSNEVNPSDAREVAAAYGQVICADAREDGGWDVLVDTANGEIIVSVVRENGELVHLA
jgi:hypothetical protein